MMHLFDQRFRLIFIHNCKFGQMTAHKEYKNWNVGGYDKKKCLCSKRKQIKQLIKKDAQSNSLFTIHNCGKVKVGKENLIYGKKWGNRHRTYEGNTKLKGKMR